MYDFKNVIYAEKNTSKDFDAKLTKYVNQICRNEMKRRFSKKEISTISMNEITENKDKQQQNHLLKYFAVEDNYFQENDLNMIDNDLLHIAISKLSFKQKLITTLYFFEGYNELEISIKLNMTQQNVAKTKKYALENLRLYLNQ